MANKVAKIEVDPKVCLGCGTCTILAEKAFELGADGLSKVKSTWTEEEDGKIISTVQSCPNGAIKVFDAEGKMLK